MRIEDMETVQKLQVKLSNCDFHKNVSEYTLRIWDGDRGGILEAYRDREEYLSATDTLEIVRIIKEAIVRKREAVISELNALGVEVR